MSDVPVIRQDRSGSENRQTWLPFSMNWITRPVFGILLAGVTIWAVYAGGLVFAFFAAVSVIAAAREWHRMISPHNYILEMTATGVTVFLASCFEALRPGTFLPWAIVVGGAALNFMLSFFRGGRSLWHGGGVFYLAIPVLALTLLRLARPDGFWLVIVLFAAIWANDTGALFTGKLVGGPKLWPALSPNKTWSGLYGGVVCAVAVEGAIFAFLHRSVLQGALLGAGVALVGHAGDLFESWTKRQFNIKNSGGLIPGHGGMLDRIDSALFAAPALAVLVLIVGIDPLAGAHP